MSFRTPSRGYLRVQHSVRPFRENYDMDNLSIPVFDGEDYGNWKTRLTVYLKLKKCHEVTTRKMQQGDKEEKWEEQNLRAMHYIFSAITNKQLEFVNDKQSAHEIMEKFDQLYCKESTALQIICRNKLDSLRLKNYSDHNEFFNVFEKYINDLKSAGAKVSEEEKLNYMLKTLPESLSYIGDLVDVLDREDRTAEYVKAKIQMKRIKENNQDSDGVKSSAFMSEKKSSASGQKVCYGCGKPGHFKRECRQTENHRGSR